MNGRYIFSSIAVVLMFGSLLYVEIKKPVGPSGTWTAEKQREYANKLKAEGLGLEAVEEYEKYLSCGGIDTETQANIYYTIGNIAEVQGEYEKALSYFYKVELVCPETKIRQELGEHIVACLEKMGRGIDAQNVVEKRTALVQEKETGGKPVARIGKEEITDAEINKELEKMPDWMKKEYENPDKKKEFLKQYIAMELLSRKAKRLGLDKDPEVRQKISDVSKELIIQRLLDKEMDEKVKMAPDQIELYYKANKDKYKDKDEKEISFEEAKERVSYDYQMEKQKVIYQELLEDTLKSEDVEIYETKTTEKTEDKQKNNEKK